MEVGFRVDGGDGRTGGGAELGRRPAVIRATPGSPLACEARTAVWWAIAAAIKNGAPSGSVSLRPGAGGQGLSFTVSPGYGDDATSNRATGLATGPPRRPCRRRIAMASPVGAAPRYRARLDTRVGYGLPLPALGGLLTPYSEMTLGAAARYNIGLRWQLGAWLDLTLAGERRTPTGQAPTDNILLRGALNF